MTLISNTHIETIQNVWKMCVKNSEDNMKLFGQIIHISTVIPSILPKKKILNKFY